MKIQGFDHLVLTTENLEKCLEFYVVMLGELGFRHEYANGRHALRFGDVKVNIHQRAGEFLPAAARPTAGSLDICLRVEAESIDEVAEFLQAKGVAIEVGPVKRQGALGEMSSIYMQDPDGNLLELAVYGEGTTGAR